MLVTTLTKKMAEDLSDYLDQNQIKVKYIHHSIDTMERAEIIRDLRLGKFDVLVGINLLREGLDIPEVALVAVLDADKEGLLRSETSLIQTVGRAARNVNGRVIMYADTITASMQTTINETLRRRTIQMRYNEEHHIQPKPIVKGIRSVLASLSPKEKETEKPTKGYAPYIEMDDASMAADPIILQMSKEQLTKSIAHTTALMKEAAKNLDFIQAAQYRDELMRLQQMMEEKN